MPFGPYEDYADCVRQNQDKDNPEAYCGYLEELLKDGDMDDVVEMVQAGNDREEFHSLLVVEGVWTGDGRWIDEYALTWRNLPLPLMGLDKTTEAHMEARLIGNITRIERVGRELHGYGSFVQSEDDQIMNLQALVRNGELRGVSVDLDAVEYEVIMDTPSEPVMDEDGNITYEGDDWRMRITSARLMGACYDDETEILTETLGWVRFEELPKGERVATMNPKTGEFEWQEPTDYTNDSWDGRMIRFTSGGQQSATTDPKKRHRSLDLLVTPNHRMLVESTSTGERVFMRADELIEKSRRSYKIPATSEWGAPDVWRVRIEPVRPMANQAQVMDFDADAFAEFMGAWLSEGSLGVNGAISISQQQDSKGYDKFAEIMGRMFKSHHHDGRCFVAKHTALAEWLRQFGGALDKWVPEEIKNMSARQIGLFLDSYIAGDGDKEGRRIYTSSERMAGDLQELAQKAGMWAHVVKREMADRKIGDRVIRANGPGYVVNLRNRPNSRPAAYCGDWHGEWVESHKGMVRCVTVPNETLYVRRNGVPIWCGNTVVPFPAFEEAFIESLPALVASLETERTASGWIASCEPVEARGFIVASGHPIEPPVVPPSSWFDNPHLDGPTPLTVTDDGHIFGHLAVWGQCHVGLGATCVTPPSSVTNYAHFLTGEILCDDGLRIPVGQITLGTTHASHKASADQTARHYDHTGFAAADVTAGEDEFGIWVSGALRPNLEPARIRELMASDVSGDWRRIGGNLELVAVLSVNVPGFPKIRVREAEGLVASLTLSAFSHDDQPRENLEHIAERIARSVGLDRESQAARIRERVQGSSAD